MLQEGSDEPDLDAGLAAAFGPEVTLQESWTGQSVLVELARSVGAETRVVLPDPETTGDGGTTTVGGGGGTRYEFHGEIARGGMGVILRGRDNDLGREVAMKVLHPRHSGNRAMVQRFVEEAQIAGQLQHPGILQVYELGMQADRRPYFTMKLIKGKTLAELLEARNAPGDERRRFLSIFERICQTMAYAHARGVIHRDLKPANVMVGNFGEVQIVDWGLAKLIGRRAEGDAAVTIIQTTVAGGESMSGAVMGTPAYMPPEQARGEIDELDERSDVFALGAILCEVLTGRAPYEGPDALDDAREGRLDPALARLAESGADEELVALARCCLAADRRDRPRSAREASSRLGAYLASADERLRSSEMAAAEARAAAAQERRARRLILALAATVVLVIAGASAALISQQNERLKQMAANSQIANEHLASLTRLLEEARQAPVTNRGSSSWMALRAGGINIAALQARASLDEETRGRVDAFLDELSVADRDRRLIETIEEAVIVGATHTDAPSWVRMEAELRRAFSEWGLDLDQTTKEDIAARIRQSPMALQITDGLELWISTNMNLAMRGAGGFPEVEVPAWVAVLGEADPDEYRQRLRRQVWAVAPERSELDALADSAEFDQALPRTQSWLAVTYFRLGDAPSIDRMDRLYQRALTQHPDDFMLNFDYALALSHLGRTEPGRWKEAIGYFRAGLAIRPKTSGMWRWLGIAYRELSDLQQAIAALNQAIDLQGDHAATWVDLGRAKAADGDVDGAVEAYRRAIDLDENLGEAHCYFGLLHMEQGRLYEAYSALQKGHQAGSKDPTWEYPSAKWLSDCERRIAASIRQP